MPKEEKGYWFSTENGTHIHAEEGESKESAMKKRFSNFNKKGEAKENSTFEEINEKRMSGKTKKHDYSEIFDEDYQRSWGVPDFKDENDIKTLNDIVEKAMEYDGDEGSIDISNNAMDRITELVQFSDEELDTLSMGTGEEIMDLLRSKEQPHLNIAKGHKLSPKELDKETKGLFKSREEGEKFINETKWDSEKDKQNAVKRLDSAFPKQLTKKGTETKLNDSKKISYDEFFESPSNKQIVDDYVEDFMFRARRNNEQDNVNVDKVLEEFKKDWVGFYSKENEPLIKQRIQEKLGK